MPADLIDQHHQMIELTEALIALLRRRPCAGAEEITQLRARLCMVGIAHLLTEDERIMKPLAASGRAAELPGLPEIIEEIRDSRRVSADHVARWPMEAIIADPEGYADALDGMRDLILTLRARKEAALYTPVLAMLREVERLQLH